MKRYIIILLALLLAASCADDPVAFLRRSHDRLDYSYLRSTRELLVQSNGRWQIVPQDDWIGVFPAEGVGTGTEQPVTVTVEQNDGDERTGSILLSGSDTPTPLRIEIVQEDGHFALGDASLEAALDIGVELRNKAVRIAYHKAKPGYKANVSASIEGPGSEGIAVEQLTGYDLAPGEGAIPVRLFGTPAHRGSFTVTLDVEIIPAEGTSLTRTYTAKSRIKLSGEVSVKVFKLLPRMVVLDWGVYERGTGTNGSNGNPRSFIFELAATEEGPALRSFESKTTEWLVSPSLFFEHNRFAFGNLQPGTTYWFRIIAREFGPNGEDSDITTLEFRTPEEIVVPNAILYKDFDDFTLGGSPIWQAFGTKVTDAQIGKNLDPDDPATLASMHTVCNPMYSTSSLFNYKDNPTHNVGPMKAAALWNACWEGDRYGTDYAAADYRGWQGFWVRLSTGSVLLSTASIQGFLKTPLLAEIGDGEANITVTCHTAPYFEPYHSWGEDHLQHYIRVEGPGTITDGGPTRSEPTGAATPNSEKQVTVACTSNVNAATKGPLYDYTIPTEHVVKIAGATRETRIVIEAHPYGTKHYRLHIDDILITRD